MNITLDDYETRCAKLKLASEICKILIKKKATQHKVALSLNISTEKIRLLRSGLLNDFTIDELKTIYGKSLLFK